MSEQATLQSIARSGHRTNVSVICRAAGAHTCSKPFQVCFRSWLWYNHISAAGAVSVTLTNAEKQARYGERQLGIDEGGVELTLNPGTRAKMGRLARRHDYTITALVEELVEPPNGR
jgi:hypothetical protein